MKSIRQNTFETNSSSCHSVTHIPKETLISWASNQYNECIWLPECEGYSEAEQGHDYKIMTIEQAMNNYNKAIDDYNTEMDKIAKDYPDCKRIRENYEKYTDEDKFEDDMQNYNLSDDHGFGKYLTFGQFMSRVVIENDMTFDVMWWNND